MIIGRKEEIKLLKDAYSDDKSHFIAVYGRRRVGKTFLIRESFDYNFTFQHAGLSKGELKAQLFAFCSSLKDSGFEFKRKPENWLEAFEGLKDVIRKSDAEKKVIFIDELSWMDTPKCDLMIALENFWNALSPELRTKVVDTILRFYSSGYLSLPYVMKRGSWSIPMPYRQSVTLPSM